MSQKSHKYTLVKLEERKPQKIGYSSNNDRAGIRKYSGQVSGLLRHYQFCKTFKNTFLSEHLRGLLLSDGAKLKEKKSRTYTI